MNFVIGLMIVVFGIFVLEFVIFLKVVFDGVVGIVIGNVVGFNIVNVFLVLGMLVLFVVIFCGE